MTPTPTTATRNGAVSAFTAFTLDTQPPTREPPPLLPLARPETAGDRKPQFRQTRFKSGGYIATGALAGAAALRSRRRGGPTHAASLRGVEPIVAFLRNEAEFLGIRRR